MSLITRPMLAAPIEDRSTIKFPAYVTRKIDGIRCLKIDGEIVSRNFKPIPNVYIREKLKAILPEGADGEIISGKSFQDCQSNVMSFEGEPHFYFYMFDYVKDDLNKSYVNRNEDMRMWLRDSFGKVDQAPIIVLFPEKIETLQELEELEKQALLDGAEGLMLRSGNSPYKCGRSSLKEGYLLKLKKFSDSEAEILGFEEKLTNNNEVQLDKFGKKKRSSKKENKVPGNTLGALIVRDIHSRITFNVGSGFDDSQKKHIWENQKDFIGKIVKYKYFEVGVKSAPRFPVFIGFRHPDDI